MKAETHDRRAELGREAGFTLLEVVVALTLMAILAVALSGSLSFGNRVWEHTARATRSSGDVTSAYQFLDASFGHLVKAPEGVADEPDAKDFVGNSQAVSFRTSGFAQVGLAGPRLMKLQVVAGRLEVSLPPGKSEAADPSTKDEKFVLLSAIRSWSIAYRGYGADHHDTGWISEWPEEDAPSPLLVRLTLRMNAEEDRVWLFRLPEIDH